MNWQQFIPEGHTIPWILAAIVVFWKLTPFLSAMREACSEPDAADRRGKVSRKRIIPLMFTALVCYMVIDNIHSCGAKTFNDVAFYILMLYIALDTTVVTLSQADGIIDRITLLKKTVVTQEKATEATTVERSVATKAE